MSGNAVAISLQVVLRTACRQDQEETGASFVAQRYPLGEPAPKTPGGSHEIARMIFVSDEARLMRRPLMASGSRRSRCHRKR
jgi:hypothetical protein